MIEIIKEKTLAVTGHRNLKPDLDIEKLENEILSQIKKYNTIPEVSILEMYRDFGGKLLTLGSDSHRNNTVGANFPQAMQIIKDLGFAEYHYYRNRKPVGVKL